MQLQRLLLRLKLPGLQLSVVTVSACISSTLLLRLHGVVFGVVSRVLTEKKLIDIW